MSVNQTRGFLTISEKFLADPVRANPRITKSYRKFLRDQGKTSRFTPTQGGPRAQKRIIPIRVYVIYSEKKLKPESHSKAT